ncbi:PAS domain-containing protein [Nocardioides guangzhouensis]|uniref:PAS domain-containing protein n=1 Tax=Nocardioides guangzhouensis TaxID=2497878 RepID=A0A4Q4Z945_9ACTN|nr:histidine kinase N-terminal 7TM domain-containing protein [Nocardioides guangzhouensis]RYP84427.1 PAS domain-containing protein [Nocardioides guangzhouensis]
MLTLFALLMAAAGLILAVLAGYVARRRRTSTGWSLAMLLIAVAWWGLAYAAELSTEEIATKSHWGDLKYVGVCLVAPVWLTFVLQYIGRGDLVTNRLLGLLAVEPALVLTVLAVPATHDLVRHYPSSSAGEDLPIIAVGPVFWVNLVYNNLVLLGATALFLTRMARLARNYRRMAAVLVVAALLPWAANLLHNFGVGWFAHLDLTPFAFIVTGAVLVWGLFRERLVNLSPMARSAVVDHMADPVFVLDAFGRVVDVNPAGTAVMRSARGAVIGRPLVDLLPDLPDQAMILGARAELTLSADGDSRTFDVLHQPLTDPSGRPAGDLVVLREITQRVKDRQELQRLLDEQSRVAAALQASMVPSNLPDLPGCRLASRYEPAGDGTEVGGDFFDVFALNSRTWGFVLGDVSGKGAEAAAVSAAARYTLRALADPARSPSDTLREVNSRLLVATEDERHCTLVYGYGRPTTEGLAVTLSLAGHHQPLVLDRGGTVEPVGRLGSALGLLDSVDLYDSAILLAPGQTLCMFTDGLVEARHAGEMFGVDRVSSVLLEHSGEPLDDQAGHLVAAVRAFHGDELTDDLALLLIQSQPCLPSRSGEIG